MKACMHLSTVSAYETHLFFSVVSRALLTKSALTLLLKRKTKPATLRYCSNNDSMFHVLRGNTELIE